MRRTIVGMLAVGLLQATAYFIALQSNGPEGGLSALFSFSSSATYPVALQSVRRLY